jgi:hypothetical protein
MIHSQPSRRLFTWALSVTGLAVLTGFCAIPRPSVAAMDQDGGHMTTSLSTLGEDYAKA